MRQYVLYIHSLATTYTDIGTSTERMSKVSLSYDLMSFGDLSVGVDN